MPDDYAALKAKDPTLNYEDKVELGMIDPETGGETPWGEFARNVNQRAPREDWETLIGQWDNGYLRPDLSLSQKGTIMYEGREEAQKTTEGYKLWRDYGFEAEYEKDKEKGPGFMGGLKAMANTLYQLPGDLHKFGVLNLSAPGQNIPGAPKREGGAMSNDNFGSATQDEKVVAFDKMYKDTRHAWSYLGGGLAKYGVMMPLEKLGMVTEEDMWETKRVQEVSLRNLENMERGKASTFMAALLTDIDDEELIGVREAVQEAAGRLEDQGLLQQTEEAGTRMVVATDPMNLAFEGVTAGVGRLAAMGRYTSMVNNASKLTVAEARIAEAVNVIDRLAPKKAMLEKLAANGMTPASRARATMALKATDDAMATAEASRLVADNAAKALMKEGPISQIAGVMRDLGAAVPTKLGQGLERLGAAVTAADTAASSKIRTGIKLAGAVSTAVSVASGHTVGAGIGMVTHAAGYLRSGEKIARMGRNLKILGAEFLAGRSTVPYWKRVAESVEGPLATAVARTSDIAARTQFASVIKGAGAGSALGYGLGYVASGGNTDEAEAMAGGGTVFGALGGIGGAIVKGNQRTFAARGIENAQKFRRQISDVDQLSSFDGIPADVQRVVGTKADLFPDLKIEFRPGGANYFDDLNNTAYINPNSSNPLKPLVAHEVLHYVTEAGMRDSIAMVLVGDEARGVEGLVKAADGTLEPRFSAFKDEYNRRMKADGRAPKDDAAMAIEYAIEGYVDELVGANLSGQLSKKAAGGMLMSGLAGDWFSATVPEGVISSRFLRHGGTVSDANGKFVPGSGLLTKGVRSYEEVNRMLRKMVGTLAGRREKNVIRIDPETGTKTTAGAGIPYGEWINDRAMHRRIKNAFEQDANGEIVYRAGSPVMLTEAQMKASNALIGSQVERALGSLTPDEVLALPEGHVKINDDGSVGGRFLSDEIVNKIDRAGILNPSQVDVLRSVNDILKNYDGESLSVMYQPAIKTKGSKRSKKAYASLSPSLYNVVPYGFDVTAAGNVLVRLVDIGKIQKNASKYLKTKRGERLYRGDVDQVMRDLETHMDNWGKRESNADYWTGQEGGSALKGKEKRDFLNAVSGYTASEQKGFNPFLNEVASPEGTVAVRTYRIDRINSVYKLQGGKYRYDYESAKQNLLPEDVYHGTPHKVDKFSLDKIGTGEGAQAYGYGLYFAGDQLVADHYRQVLSRNQGMSNPSVYVDGKKVTGVDDRAGTFISFAKQDGRNLGYAVKQMEMTAKMTGEDPAPIRKSMESMWDKKVESRNEAGNLYTVKLKPEAHEFLDWDRPLSEQSEGVRKALEKVSEDYSARSGDYDAAEKGQMIYQRVANTRPDPEMVGVKMRDEKAASAALHKAGIKGIRYLDGNSRGKGDGSYNYVVFDEADITITHENGKPVTKQERADVLGQGDGVRRAPEPLKQGHKMLREDFNAEVAKIKPLPHDVFYVGDTEVIRNPSNAERKRMGSEVREEFGRQSSDDPTTRFTNDERGNTWIWKAHKGMHSQIEPGITSREGTGVNQNSQKPTHADVVKQAIRDKKQVPKKVQAQYPQYKEYFNRDPQP